MKVIVHADDLGISRGISDRIVETHRHGCLQRTSIAANTDAFDYAVQKLKENRKLDWAIHLNLAEGRCLAPQAELPLLVDRRGRFKSGFIRLLLLPVLAPWCSCGLRRQIRRELDAQVERVRTALKPKRIRIDSHRHIHLLPVVFEVLLDRVADWGVQEIRIVNEPLFTCAGGFGALRELLSPNLIKHLLLRLLSGACRRRLNRRSGGIRCPAGFLGVLYSGRMSARVVEKGLRRIAGRQPAAEAEEVEVLFHPGPADPQDSIVWQEDSRHRNFYFSRDRAAETRALLSPELRRIVESYGGGEGL